MSTGKLTNIGQHDWIAVTLTANQAYETTITGLSQDATVSLGTADGLSADGLGASGIASIDVGLIPGSTQNMYFMPATSGTYYIDVADPFPLAASESYTVSVVTTTADFTDNPTAPGTVSVGAPCFAQGTRIRTDRGMVAVERLCTGDCVHALFASRAMIKWIGYRHVDCRCHPNPEMIWPIRICRGAFGVDRPKRDLVLSPDHAVFADGVLIPIRYLVNGTSVKQESADKLSYWHVELEQHDVIYAEGLLCESFLDTGNRGAFTNGDNIIELRPDFASQLWEARGCAKLVVTGEPLNAVRSYLARRAEEMQTVRTEQAIAQEQAA